MKLHRVHIRNLKLLDSLDVALDGAKEVYLVYGANGIGKTTFIEAISLLGHLPSMTRVWVDPGDSTPAELSIPRLWEAVNDNQVRCIADQAQPRKHDLSRQVIERSYSPLLRNLAGEQHALESWFLRESAAVVRYELEIESNVVTTLYIYMCPKTKDSLTITQALGRKKCDDLKFGQYFSVIGSKRNRQRISHLIDQHLNTCTFIDTNGSEVQQRASASSTTRNASAVAPLFFESKNRTRTTPVGHVFYLNTDLNDFGRMRDVRESVKDLESDFFQEWKERFGIDLSTHQAGTRGTTPSTAEQLEHVMNSMVSTAALSHVRPILTALVSMFPLLGKLFSHKALFTITKFDFEQDGRLVLEVRRPGFKGSKRIDYLSAGENECFFLFLYLFGTSINNSICLLDEPDLHLSQFSKRAFFEALYSVLRKQNCQTIISTHSGFAYLYPRTTSKLLLRQIKVKRTGKYVYKTRFTRTFGLALALHYWRTAFSVLGIGGGMQMAIAVLLMFASGSFVFDFAYRERSHVDYTSYLTHPALLIAGCLYYSWRMTKFTREIRGTLPLRKQ